MAIVMLENSLLPSRSRADDIVAFLAAIKVTAVVVIIII